MIKTEPTRNCYLQVGDGVRATLLGVVSRGIGCAQFNSPAIYGSVPKAFDWIKDTIAKEMSKEDEACPADLKDNLDVSAPEGNDYSDLPTYVKKEESNHYLKKVGSNLYVVEQA